MHPTKAITTACGLATPAPVFGGQEPVVSLIDFHPPNRPSLADLAIWSVEQELHRHGVKLTTSTRTSLYEAAKGLEAMSEGTLPPQFHLSSLDPGVGKTTLIKHFIMALLSSQYHEEVSVLVCFARLGEIDTMLSGLPSAYKPEVAVWTGDDALNAKASTPPQEARVLLTTQQKLEAVCGRQGSFSMATGFHYLGRPREVRIWDESLLPGKEVLLSEDDLSSLWGHFRRSAPQLFGSLEALHGQLKEAATGDILHVPDLDEMAGGPVGSAEVARLRASDKVSDLDRERLERLQQAAGETLPVHKNNYGEAKLLDYRDTLPKDLAPMVVFDASGRCRKTYVAMEDHRKNLVRLPSATKNYSNLEIGLWSRGSGKTAHASDKDEVLIRGIAETIMERPHEEWLIIHHKDGLASFKRRVEAHLGDGFTGELHFLSWGKHHGTNDYAKVSNVILASLLHLPPEVYETRVRLCAGMEQTEVVTEEKRKEMAEGELMHNILQALCRASVRGLQADGTCPPCRAYIIAPKLTGLWESLPTLFPHCKLKRWQPSGTTKLTGSIKKALEKLDEWDGEDTDGEIAYAALAEAIGMDRKDFKRVASDPRFKEEVAKRGYAEAKVVRKTAKGPRMANGLVREAIFPADPSPFAWVPDPD